MATRKTPRRKSSTATNKGQTRNVENMLRELAYVLHVTRKINQDIPWPIVTKTSTRKSSLPAEMPAAAV